MFLAFAFSFNLVSHMQGATSETLEHTFNGIKKTGVCVFTFQVDKPVQVRLYFSWISESNLDN